MLTLEELKQAMDGAVMVNRKNEPATFLTQTVCNGRHWYWWRVIDDRSGNQYVYATNDKGEAFDHNDARNRDADVRFKRDTVKQLPDGAELMVSFTDDAITYLITDKHKDQSVYLSQTDMMAVVEYMTYLKSK